MKNDDLPAVERLVEGRNVHPDEYARFLKLEGGHGFMLESDDGALVGATTVFRCFERAVLGPTLLAAHAEGPGTALAMLGASIQQLQHDGVTLLEAEAGDVETPLLEAMGFRAVRRTLILERPPGPTGLAPATRAMERADLLDVGALDADAVGYGRKQFIAALLDGARVREAADGAIDGFVAVRRARRGYHLGPLVTRASDVDGAKRLALDAVGAVSSWPVVALAPAQSALVAALEEAGFAQVGALTRLRAGDKAAAPEVAHEWLVGSRLTG